MTQGCTKFSKLIMFVRAYQAQATGKQGYEIFSAGPMSTFIDLL
jgi:hypothetical protein